MIRSQFPLPALVATILLVPPLSAVSIDGDWNATLEVGAAKLRLAWIPTESPRPNAPFRLPLRRVHISHNTWRAVLGF